MIILLRCSLFGFLLIPFLATAGTRGESVEKKINREFNIQANGRLSIENKYGDLDIAIGESNHIKFDITVKVKAGSQKKAQDILDNITVNFNEGMNHVEAITEIQSSNSWMSWFGSSSQEIEINYQVLVPRDVYLDLRNKYGSIYLESTDRDADIDLAYGDIRLGDINANLELEMSYSDGSLSQIKQGKIRLSYSDLEMENSQSLSVDMKYTDLVTGSSGRMDVVSSYGDLKGGDVAEVSYTGKYDDVQFDRVKSITADCSYAGIEVGEMASSGSFDMRYGDLSISNIWPDFKRIDISTSYTGVKLDFREGANLSLEAETNYCDIHYGNELKVSERIERGASLSLKASRGSGGGAVKAVMNYGELTIQ
jgi:hypothetical protein